MKTNSWADFAAAATDDRHRGAPATSIEPRVPRSSRPLRGDAPPGIHPVTVGIVGDGLYVFLLDSAKAQGPRWDGGSRSMRNQDQAKPDEFSVRGRARLVPAGETRTPSRPGWFFEVDDNVLAVRAAGPSAILGERGADEWPPRYTRWSASGT
jgi:hypothetical protein